MCRLSSCKSVVRSELSFEALHESNFLESLVVLNFDNLFNNLFFFNNSVSVNNSSIRFSRSLNIDLYFNSCTCSVIIEHINDCISSISRLRNIRLFNDFYAYYIFSNRWRDFTSIFILIRKYIYVCDNIVRTRLRNVRFVVVSFYICVFGETIFDNISISRSFSTFRICLPIIKQPYSVVFVVLYTFRFFGWNFDHSVRIYPVSLYIVRISCCKFCCINSDLYKVIRYIRLLVWICLFNNVTTYIVNYWNFFYFSIWINNFNCCLFIFSRFSCVRFCSRHKFEFSSRRKIVLVFRIFVIVWVVDEVLWIWCMSLWYPLVIFSLRFYILILFISC